MTVAALAFLQPHAGLQLSVSRRPRRVWTTCTTTKPQKPPEASSSPDFPPSGSRPTSPIPPDPALSSPATPQHTQPASPTASNTPVLPKKKKLSNVQIVAERFADTAYDVYLHYARQAKLRSDSRSSTAERRGKRIVVLGSGWGAHSLIKVIDIDRVQSITVISPRNYFFFTPLLSSTAVGTTEFRSIVEPIRRANPLTEYYEAYATDVDLENQIVHCQSGQRDGFPSAEGGEFKVPYDILVIAVGETTSTFGVSGARKYAHFLKEIPDARRLRAALLEALEKAALPIWTDDDRRRILHFVVVGGGPTGCEFAGELADFVASDLALKYEKELVSLIRVTLLQSGDSLLTQFEESLQLLALDNFQSRVNIEFNSRVVKVNETSLELRDGRVIDYGILVWAAGNATRPIISKLIEAISGEPQDQAAKKRRKLLVDPWLRVKGTTNVFALGDCSLIEGEPLPATAQVAGQQGAFVGRLISKAKDVNREEGPVLLDAEDREISPFHFLSLGAMAYLGNDRAVVQFEASPKRNLLLGGRIAFFLWRSVYAVKQVHIRNRVLVLFDWFKTRAFGRDVSQF